MRTHQSTEQQQQQTKQDNKKQKRQMTLLPVLTTAVFIVVVVASSILLDLATVVVHAMPEDEGEEETLDTLKLLQYISPQLPGHKSIINGMHNDDNTHPLSKTLALYNTKTWDWPGLYGSDFLFTQEMIDARPKVIQEAIKQWNLGSIVTLSWHICDPRMGDPCYWDAYWTVGNGIKGRYDDTEWNNLFTPSHYTYKNLYGMFDRVASQLQILQNNGVEVLFRPFHEMNSDFFWWAGRPGLNGTSRLYRAIHDYFTDAKQLHNLGMFLCL
jgi:Glycosyl hydrolase family 26